MDTGAPPVVLQESAGPAEPGRRRVGRQHLEQLEQQQLGGGTGATASPPGSEPAGGAHTHRSPGVLGKRGQAQRALLTSKGPTPATAKQSGAGRTPRKAAKPEPAQVPEPRTPEQPSVPEPRTPPQAATEPEPAPAEPQQEAAEPEPTAEATGSGDPATQTKPEPTELEEAAQAADGAFVVVKEEPDYSEDEPLPQTDPPAAASWVFVRDLLDEAAANPEAPTSPAQAPEEASAATADSSTGAGGPAQAGGTAQAGSPAGSTLGSTIESLGVSEGSRDGDAAIECADSAADRGSGGPAAC